MKTKKGPKKITWDVERFEKGRDILFGYDRNHMYVLYEKYNNILFMETRREFAQDVRKRVFKKYWRPLCKEGNKYGKIWGWKPKKKEKIIFTFSPGVSQSWVDDMKKTMLTSEKKDLPLFINEAKAKGDKQLLKDLLSGKEKLIPHKQKIVDMYYKEQNKAVRPDLIVGIVNDRLCKRKVPGSV